MLYLMHSIDQGELAGAIGSFRWLLVWTTPDKQGHTGTLIALVVSVGVCSIRENASLSHICRRLHYPVMHNSFLVQRRTPTKIQGRPLRAAGLALCRYLLGFEAVEPLPQRGEFRRHFTVRLFLHHHSFHGTSLSFVLDNLLARRSRGRTAFVRHSSAPRDDLARNPRTTIPRGDSSRPASLRLPQRLTRRHTAESASFCPAAPSLHPISSNDLFACAHLRLPESPTTRRDTRPEIAPHHDRRGS